MKVCIISKKECWQDADGKWYSSGGFPAQMSAIASLFDETAMLIVQVPPKQGGIPLPPQAQVFPLTKPEGEDARRKLSVISRLPYYINNLVKHIKAADVVHTPLPGDISILGYLMAILLRKRLIARYGSSWQDNSQTTWMNKAVKKSMAWFAGGNNVMIATGRGKTPPARGMHWLYSTALSDEEIRSIRPNLQRDLGKPATIVYIGRLSVEKGVLYLIEAMGKLKAADFQSMPQVRIIGDGPERSLLEGRVKALSLENEVTFLGQVDREKLFDLLREADFSVQPSLTESSSKAWLDAMAAGLPVVASQVGDALIVLGAPGERGWVSPAGDAEALAQKLMEILSTEDNWPARRQRCRTYVEALTLENWAYQINLICASQWNLNLIESRQGI